MTVEFRSKSLWLEGVPHEPGSSLRGEVRADVAIIGGGFTGLWTALRLREAAPNLVIAVVEGAVVGYGASGRNGGLMGGTPNLPPDVTARRYGREAALAECAVMRRSVDEIGQFVRDHQIDCGYVKGGSLSVSVAPWQDPLAEQTVRSYERVGLEPPQLLTGEEVRSRVNSPTYRLGTFEPHTAVVDPARLVAGLSRVAREWGVQIYEESPVTGIRSGGNGVLVETRQGLVRAEKAVVATNAFSAWWPPTGRHVVPLYGYIVATEPLTEEQWAQVGWQNRESVTDRYAYFHYYQRAADGRIAWGGASGGVRYPFGSRTSPEYDRDEARFAALRQEFYNTFPQLRDVRFSHAWGGPVGFTMRREPAIGSLLGGRVHHAIGFNGHGLVLTYVAGGILRDRLLERSTELTELYYARAKPVLFPPEPMRWGAIKYTARAILHNDRVGRTEEPLLLRWVGRLARGR